MSMFRTNGARAAGIVRGFVLTSALYFFVAVFATTAFAADEANTGGDGVAIHGYDPVAYFDPGKPVKGSATFTARHLDITYWFSSAENLATFNSNPVKYAPAYGGWCSYGVRVGKKFDIDPAAFKVVNGRLFMQLDLGTQMVWRKDLQKNIEIADRLWPRIASVPAKLLGE